jgi:ribosomal protein S18 acetylase RimI-like enzyme
MSEPTMRPPSTDDQAALGAFVSRIPEADRRFLPEDISDAGALLERWIGNPCARRLLMLDGDEIVGMAAAIRGTGWSSHVAQIEVLVAVSHRRRGLGRMLARRALVLALELGCTHVCVEVVAEQTALVRMFEELGFDPEALLRDFVRDAGGDCHDLMLLTHRVEDHEDTLTLAGLELGLRD